MTKTNVSLSKNVLKLKKKSLPRVTVLFSVNYALRPKTRNFLSCCSPSKDLILPIDNTNNPAMEVIIDHDVEVVIFCQEKKVNSNPNDRVVVIYQYKDKFYLNFNIVDIDQSGMQRNIFHRLFKKKTVFQTLLAIWEMRIKSAHCGHCKCGFISQIGFFLNQAMYPGITVCHYQTREQTFYSNHTLYGKLLHYKSIDEQKENLGESRLYLRNIFVVSVYLWIEVLV